MKVKIFYWETYCYLIKMLQKGSISTNFVPLHSQTEIK